MIRYLLVFGLSITMITTVYAQEEDKKPFDKTTLPELRSNSRDITPVRRTNLHQRVDIRKKRAIVNTKRQALRKKRARFQRQKLMQNRQRLIQMRQKMRQHQMRRNRH